MVPTKKDQERHLARFLDIFKKLEITMPFGDALQQMSLYSKFLKDMLSRKNKYIHSENIIVEGNCSAVIQRILPPKHKDPGSVTIPCSIGEVSVGKALIDLGASINLMPFCMLSYPNFVRGLLLDDMQPLVSRFETLGVLCCTINEVPRRVRNQKLNSGYGFYSK